MSKPIVRVAFFLLISLALIAATSVGVRSLLDRPAGVAGAQMQANVVISSPLQSQPASPHHNGGCHSDPGVSSSDY